MELKPFEFWKLTPAEFAELAAGYKWRQKQQHELAAWVVYYLMAVHLGRKTPSIDALLGREERNAVTRPDGLIVSGDASILAPLLEGPGDPGADRDAKVRQFLAQVQAQKDEGAAN